MWAATARPVRRLNVNRQDTTAVGPDLVTVAVNTPRARATAPLGLGTSCRALSTVLTLASTPIWPLISPGAFAAV
jgi:hypothetical protein